MGRGPLPRSGNPDRLPRLSHIEAGNGAEIVDEDDLQPQTAAETELLETAIVELLTQVPGTWAESDRDSLSDAQNQALYWLSEAGMTY